MKFSLKLYLYCLFLQVPPVNPARNTAKPRHLETAQSLKKAKNFRKTAKIIVNQRANRQKQLGHKTRKRTQLVKLVKLTRLVKIVKVRLEKLAKVHLVRLVKAQIVKLVKDQIVRLVKDQIVRLVKDQIVRLAKLTQLVKLVKVTQLVNSEEQMRISDQGKY